jgi:hypothetical protein
MGIYLIRRRLRRYCVLFAASFAGLEDAICNWAVIGKTNKKPTFPTVFSLYRGDDEHLLEIK